MTIALLAAVWVAMLVLAFLMPRLLEQPRTGVDRTLGAGRRARGKLPL